MKRVELRYTCSDYERHEHRFRFTAWLCGRWQFHVRHRHQQFIHVGEIERER